METTPRTHNVSDLRRHRWDTWWVRSDGRVLPDLAEVLVLHELGLIRTDELPDLAARWLAAEMVDTESSRILAGHDRRDPGSLEVLLSDVASEAGVVLVPRDSASVEAIAVSWVVENWRDDRDTWAAVQTLARLGERFPDFDVGLFVGLADEQSGGWGRLDPELKAEARKEIVRILHGPTRAGTGSQPRAEPTGVSGASPVPRSVPGTLRHVARWLRRGRR